MQPEVESSEQERVELLVKKAELEAEYARLKVENAEYIRLKAKIIEFEVENAKFKAEKAEFLKSTKKYYTDFEGYIVKLKHLSSQYPDHLESIEALILEIKVQNTKNKSIIEEYEKELESKKNRKFQTRCIQITKEILNEEPMIEYRPLFLNGLELDAFFQRYRIALEVQGAQHRLHNTSWYKDVKKLEGIINRDRQKRCICLDNGIFLLEVWYDEKPEIVIPKGSKKLRSLFV
ncbi:4377_t:CDS:1 [Racocetra persica]|uniref:4377_t:CDS:1 n=1 Tax=Racocetra persica TaxID=160502 RepID=A0ACA9R3D3_9GLOM|nr:4377_t:CDS:1 [Racocetra persica]